jgi:glutamyl-tRNA synthetase
LFNWAFARHVGGTFVFRIEDTDSARDSEESYQALLDTLTWLGLSWDEGPEVGGPFGPYRQSERLSTYRDVAERLLAAGAAYESFSTPEEVEQRRRDAGQDPKLGYDNADRLITAEQRAAFIDQGRTPVLRMRMPDHDIVVDDLVRGEIQFPAGSVPDYVIVRANGEPLYTLVNPVDDILMGITHVLRGEDLLSSTPRQIVMHQALHAIGLGAGDLPVFGHLPYVMGEGNKKLSKRDPQSSIAYYREQGFTPEGLINYLALLGWALAEDRDIFSIDELVAAFEIHRVNASPARFDVKKAEAINAAHIRALPASVFAERVLDRLVCDHVLPVDPSPEQRAMVSAAAPLVQERMVLLSEATGMLRFLFEDRLVIEESAATLLTSESRPTLQAALTAVDQVSVFDAKAIEDALRSALIEGLGLKPKTAFGPVRAAVTGRRVSPPLFESLELLGRDRVVQRLSTALEAAAG